MRCGTQIFMNLVHKIALNILSLKDIETPSLFAPPLTSDRLGIIICNPIIVRLCHSRSYRRQKEASHSNTYW